MSTVNNISTELVEALLLKLGLMNDVVDYLERYRMYDIECVTINFEYAAYSDLFLVNLKVLSGSTEMVFPLAVSPMELELVRTR